MSPSLKVLVICLKETGGELCLSFYTFFMTNQFRMLTVAPLNLGVLLQGSSGPSEQLPAEGVGGAWEEGESQGGEGGSHIRYSRVTSKLFMIDGEVQVQV